MSKSEFIAKLRLLGFENTLGEYTFVNKLSRKVPDIEVWVTDKIVELDISAKTVIKRPTSTDSFTMCIEEICICLKKK